MRGERRDAKFTLHRAIDLRRRQEPKPFRGTPQSPKPHCTRRLVARVRWFLWCIYSLMIGADLATTSRCELQREFVGETGCDKDGWLQKLLLKK